MATILHITTLLFLKTQLYGLKFSEKDATDLRHLFAVGLGVERRLCEQNGMLLGSDTQFVVECVMPDLLHVVPVGDDSVFDWVLQRQNTSLALCLVANVAVLLTHTDHDALRTSHIS